MVSDKTQRRLTAILIADVHGYSRLMGDDEEATIATLAAYREVFVSRIKRHHGRVVDAKGDAILAEFASVTNATACAVEIQRELADRNGELPALRRMDFRIGINLGDVIVQVDAIYGDGVNVASRLEGLAEPGGICVSRSVYDQVHQKAEVAFEYLGTRKVKNIREPVPAYRVVLAPGGGHFIRGAWHRVRPMVWTAAVVAALAVGVGGWFYTHGGPPWSRHARQTAEAPAPASAASGATAPTAEAPAAAGNGLAAHREAMGGTMGARPGMGMGAPAAPAAAMPARMEEAPPPLPDKPSIAVLPFTNMSGDAKQEYFSDGMTEDIITDLSKISGLFVIARNSTFAYKGQAVDARRISRELGVRYILEGSVRKAAGRVRINAQLIDATTGSHVWADRYDRPLQDVFAVQDEIGREIVNALKVKLGGSVVQPATPRSSRNFVAYDLYLRGLELRRRFTKETNEKARRRFREAIDKDPSFAEAYAALGSTYFVDWALQWNPDPQVLEEAQAWAGECLKLDKGLASCHSLMSSYLLWKKRHGESIAAAETAVRLAPNDATTHAALAEALSFAGRPAEALERIMVAKRLDPYYPFHYLWTMGHCYFLLHRNDEARDAFKRVLVRNPNFAPAYIYLIVINLEQGNEAEARKIAAGLARFPNQGTYVSGSDPILPYKRKQELERLRAAIEFLAELGTPDA